MGDIRKYTCNCGYEKELFAGGGIAGCNMNRIADFFPEAVKVFQKERNEGRAVQYLMENEIAYCGCCQDIYALPAFSYKRKDGYTCHFASACPVCGGSITRVEDEEDIACPKCGQRMEYEVLGRWD